MAVVEKLRDISRIGSEIEMLTDWESTITENKSYSLQSLDWLRREQVRWEGQIVDFGLGWDRELLDHFEDASEQLSLVMVQVRKVRRRRFWHNWKFPFLWFFHLPCDVDLIVRRVDKILRPELHELKWRIDIAQQMQMGPRDNGSDGPYTENATDGELAEVTNAQQMQMGPRDNGSDGPYTENATDGELAEVTNGGPMIAVSKSPDMEQQVVSRTSSICMEGPKLPWKKGRALGQGAFGRVYKALDSAGRFFAVKVIPISEHANHPEAVAQLKQEVELMKKLKHGNIVQYLGTDQAADELHIFLELAEVGSLETLYQDFELADPEISNYTRDILAGLGYLHDQKILHRDIKCANILVYKTGTCKLADFGVAKQISTLTPARTARGTGKWMAPEVINNKRKESYGPPADIWSLGCSVLEMATRAHPFPELDWFQAMYQVAQGKAPPIPDTVSGSLRDFIERCLEIDPEKRATVTELLQHPFFLELQGH